MSTVIKKRPEDIFSEASNKADFMQKVFAALSFFPKNQFQLRHSKTWKK